MIVCLCHRISDQDIRRAACSGVRDFDELQDETCIARNCECCLAVALEVFEEAQRTASTAKALLAPDDISGSS